MFAAKCPGAICWCGIPVSVPFITQKKKIDFVIDKKIFQNNITQNSLICTF